ncbi:hypothetical protein [Occallatibacter riparius]|nr:hypothetical protein [Occallatibacter riparius]
MAVSKTNLGIDQGRNIEGLAAKKEIMGGIWGMALYLWLYHLR